LFLFSSLVELNKMRVSEMASQQASEDSKPGEASDSSESVGGPLALDESSVEQPSQTVANSDDVTSDAGPAKQQTSDVAFGIDLTAQVT
jgi:hypothetical protein